MKNSRIADAAELLALPAPRGVGGKAEGLLRLMEAGLPVPDFFVVGPEAPLHDVLARWTRMGRPPVAVRSSALGEDGARHSFAGMYSSVVGVTDEDALAAALGTCRDSARSAHIAAYRAHHGLEVQPVWVVVQEVVEAQVSGVLFTADPMDPERAVLSVAWGMGEGVVQGLVSCDRATVDLEGTVAYEVERKDLAVALGATEAGPVPESEQLRACLDEAEVSAVVATARGLARRWGGPLDLELAWREGEVHWLQARPVTRPVPQGRRRLWDNANIIESYHGLVGPLTYSFASRAYTIVYQLFCEVMGVDGPTLRQNSDLFSRMIGLIRGRVYYNLNAWYGMVALLPGYRWNRPFMEQMMGVAEVAGEEEAPPEGSRWAALPEFAWKTGKLLFRLRSLERDVAAFKATFALAEDRYRATNLDELDAHEVIDLYFELERSLLWEWSVPIVNDFFVMVSFGLLRSLCAKWLPEHPGLHNALLAGDGDLASTAPGREGATLARLLVADPETAALLAEREDPAAALAALQAHPTAGPGLQRWLALYGDRSPDELKLEVPTWAQRPAHLLQLFEGLAQAPATTGQAEQEVRATAEGQVSTGLGLLRRVVFARVLHQARTRVREREALRLLRTRVFGMVRGLFTRLGVVLAEAEATDDPRDVFWLTLDEVLGFVRGTTPTVDLRGLVVLRKAEYARWEQEPAPADRFLTWGPVWAHNAFAGRPRPVPEGALQGLAAFGGVVEGRVRRVDDPRGEPPLAGEILVAYRTDPGWLPLFHGAAAILVERGSLLSHSAVVARELGIPTVVAVAGLMDRLKGGELLRVDAGAGIIDILETSDPSEGSGTP